MTYVGLIVHVLKPIFERISGLICSVPPVSYHPEPSRSPQPLCRNRKISDPDKSTCCAPCLITARWFVSAAPTRWGQWVRFEVIGEGAEPAQFVVAINNVVQYGNKASCLLGMQRPPHWVQSYDSLYSVRTNPFPSTTLTRIHSPYVLQSPLSPLMWITSQISSILLTVPKRLLRGTFEFYVRVCKTRKKCWCSKIFNKKDSPFS